MVEEVKIRPNSAPKIDEESPDVISPPPVTPIPRSEEPTPQALQDPGALGRLEKARGGLGGTFHLFARAFDALKGEINLSDVEGISGYDAGEQTALTRLQEIEEVGVFSDNEVDEVISMFS